MSGAKRIGEFLWQAMPDGPEKYQAYLASHEWAQRRSSILKRCSGICERCHSNPAENIHHRTYARKYQERLTDLIAYCRGCHEWHHDKTKSDPLKQAIEDRKLAEPLVQNLRETDFSKRQSALVCPICEMNECHIDIANIKIMKGEKTNGIVVPMWCEAGHSWDVNITYTKGSVLCCTSNIGDRDA
jgi:hypothetical protein